MLRLLHPAMPFITEELWQRLAGGPTRPASIALVSYPQYRREATDFGAEREIGILQEIVTMARTLRAENKLDPKQRLAGTLFSANDTLLEIVRRHGEAIQKLANVGLTLEGGHFGGGTASGAGFGDGTGAGDEPGGLSAVRSTAEFDLMVRVPKSQEEAQGKRIAKEREQLEKNIANSKRQLSDEVFLGKAPQKVVDSIRAKLADYETQLAKLP
jgi:valyl-tRNA synthetase